MGTRSTFRVPIPVSIIPSFIGGCPQSEVWLRINVIRLGRPPTTSVDGTGRHGRAALFPGAGSGWWSSAHPRPTATAAPPTPKPMLAAVANFSARSWEALAPTNVRSATASSMTALASNPQRPPTSATAPTLTTIQARGWGRACRVREPAWAAGRLGRGRLRLSAALVESTLAP